MLSLSLSFYTEYVSLSIFTIPPVSWGFFSLCMWGINGGKNRGGNILVDKNGCCKLVDFGCAAEVCSDMSKRVTVVGSPYWSAYKQKRERKG